MLRARGFLAALFALVESAAGCTIVVGERPDQERGDADVDANVDLDAGNTEEPDRDPEEHDGSVTPGADADGSDANELDADAEEASVSDSGVALDGAEDASGGELDAGSEGDAGQDAAADDAAQDSAPPDAGSVDAGADCSAPDTWYPDDDGDGFGRTAAPAQACEKPGSKWSRQGGDCHDDNDEVFPGQTAFFETAYIKLTGGDSFDYDCSNTEEGKPGQASLEGGCMSLLGLGLDCNDITGYMPRPDRTGGGRNAMCGSTILARCQGSLLSCTPGSPGLAPSPYACR